MKIKSLNLINFRNWDERRFDFSDRVLIYGPNARGKTNILEAIFLTATTRSFRGRDAGVIKEGRDFMKLEAILEKDKEIDVLLTFKRGERVEKEFKIQEKKRPTIDFVGEFSAIVFSPDDINLISGTPSDRRRYLSYTIGQKDKEYLYDLLNYKKILRQRNELLKKADLGTIKEEIDVWDTSLSEYGEKVIRKRKSLEEFINKKLNFYYEKLSGEQKDLRFLYLPSADIGKMKEEARESRNRDIAERTTTVGPHRDSWDLVMDGVPAEGYASRGEYRTLILALKLCERDYFVERDGILPVVLLDDVFSELDVRRRRYLIEAFAGSQIIITTTDLDHLDASLRSSFQLIEIDKPQPALLEVEESVAKVPELKPLDSSY
ncbi:MAG: DNA replication/repair protein RecF [Patescibacteria group bacterium]|nr:DNA replication/repair protein RecF [Patescibacteria group bacterium]